MGAALSKAYAEWRGEMKPAEIRAMFDKAELEDMAQMVVQREFDRTDNTKTAISSLEALDRFTTKQQLHDIFHALACLSERVHSQYQSEAMRHLCDDVNNALGWAQTMLEDGPDSAQDAVENYGGTDD